MLLGFFHMLAFVCELFLYNLMISALATELFMLWLCFYCFMTMNNIVLYVYIAILFLSGGFGVLSILQAGGWFIIYIA